MFRLLTDNGDGRVVWVTATINSRRKGVNNLNAALVFIQGLKDTFRHLGHVHVHIHHAHIMVISRVSPDSEWDDLQMMFYADLDTDYFQMFGEPYDDGMMREMSNYARDMMGYIQDGLIFGVPAEGWEGFDVNAQRWLPLETWQRAQRLAKVIGETKVYHLTDAGITALDKVILNKSQHGGELDDDHVKGGSGSSVRLEMSLVEMTDSNKSAAS